MKINPWIACAIAVVFIPLAFVAGRGCAPQVMKETAHDSASVPTERVSVQSVTAAQPTPRADSSGPYLGRPRDGSKFRFLAQLVDSGSLSLSSPSDSPSDSSGINPAALIRSLRDAFSACSGARLPSGDSVYACFTVTPSRPEGMFTFEQFIADRIVNVPAPRVATPDKSVATPDKSVATPDKPIPPAPATPFLPMVDAAPLKTLFYGTMESSTRDLIAGGFGVETTASSVAIDSLGVVSLRARMRIAAEAMVLPKPPFGYLKVKGDYFF